VARVTSKTEQSFFTRLISPFAGYLKETRAELRKVSWPSRDEAWSLTLIVLGTTLVMSLLLAAGDFIFSKIVQGMVTSDLLWIGVGALVVIGGAVAIYLVERE